MDKPLVPSLHPEDLHGVASTAPRRVKRNKAWRGLLAALLLFVVVHNATSYLLSALSNETVNVPINAAEILDKCDLLDVKPGPPPDFNLRKQSDRFVPGTKPTLIKNATIWTGRVNGLEVLKGDILLDNGLIIAVGHVPQNILDSRTDVSIIDVEGAWVSPGIVDLHSHLTVDSAPQLRGSNDGNSHKGPILPWLRAFDALNTHDASWELSIAGGVTTSLVLPGSANAIGGQGVVIKLRPTQERSPTSLLLENPYTINVTEYDPSLSFRWRQMKHACGENPDRVYSNTRMDTAWAFREGYNKARQIKHAQDQFCAKARAGQWKDLGDFPYDLQWEALVDVLRGRVKVHTHCYETIDLDDLVRITNEFEFSIAAFHHAHETYLVPETLKSAYGHPPAAALFATNARYKRESYRGSEFAPKVLADNGLQVVMKSDHPVLDSRFLLYEAQQAHFYGLPHNLALAAVTTTPAEVMGMDHRIGFIKQGYDADIVVWDSHPLALGATPKQVWIDGIAQLDFPYSVAKPASAQHLPATPDFTKEVALTLKHDGLPPLAPAHSAAGSVVFANISSMWAREAHDIVEVFAATQSEPAVAVARAGRVVCYGPLADCTQFVDGPETAWVDLQGGALAPALVSFGSPLGLEEIRSEPSTADGYVVDALRGELPGLVGGEQAVIRAADGLHFATRDALLAYRSGVTTGVVAPRFVPGTTGFLQGLSTAFAAGAAHKLEKGAIVQDIAALHVAVGPSGIPSVSTQIAALRRLLLTPSVDDGELGRWASKVTEGSIPLVVEVHSADAIASLIELKQEVEAHFGHPIKVTLSGASEAHILAPELGAAKIGVIISPARPYPSSWEKRRILPGLPLSEHSAVEVLLAQNVTVGLGVPNAWQARSTRFDAAWTALESGGGIARTKAHALASVNLESLLGLHVADGDADMVATRGGDLLDFSKVVGILSPRRGVIDLL